MARKQKRVVRVSNIARLASFGLEPCYPQETAKEKETNEKEPKPN